MNMTDSRHAAANPNSAIRALASLRFERQDRSPPPSLIKVERSNADAVTEKGREARKRAFYQPPLPSLSFYRATGQDVAREMEGK